MLFLSLHRCAYRCAITMCKTHNMCNILHTQDIQYYKVKWHDTKNGIFECSRHTFFPCMSVHKDVHARKTICVPRLEKFHNICLILCYVFNKWDTRNTANKHNIDRLSLSHTTQSISHIWRGSVEWGHWSNMMLLHVHIFI